MKVGLSKKSIMSSIPFVAIVELVIVFGCMQIQALMTPTSAEGTMGAFIYDAVTLASFLVPTFVMLAFMYFTKRESLRIFGGKLRKNGRAFAIGLLIGFVANGVISLVAGATGSVTYVFNALTPLLVAIIPLCFIQCASEEIVDRGFVPAYLEPTHDWTVVGAVSGVLFAISHALNVVYCGFNAVFVLNVVLLGVILYLLTKQLESFWAAPGFHFAWNYTQQYVFGLPNSGYSTPFALLAGTNAQSTFFYDATYGNEGSMLTLVITVVMVVVLVVLLRRKKAAAQPASSNVFTSTKED